MKKTANKRKLILKNKNFIKLWLSQIFSQLTIYITNFIFIDRIFGLTKSALAVSFIWIFYALPSILIAPVVGFLIDLWDNRKILVITNFLQAVTIALYLLLRNHSFYFIYILVFIYSSLNQFYLPTEAASIPWLVKKDFYPIANSLFLLTTQFSLIFGFGLGGILLKTFSETNTIVGVCLLLLGAVFSVYLLPKEKEKEKPIPQFSNFIVKEVKKGWDFLLKKRVLVLFALGLMALFQIMAVVISLLLPAVSAEIIKAPFSEAAPILILSLGLGLVFGSFIFSRINQEKRKKAWIITGLLVLGLSLAAIALAGGLDFIPQKLTFIIPAIFVGGLASVFVFIPAQTFIQENTPRQLRGRVFGILIALITLATIPPTLLIATLVDILGVIKFIWLVAFLVIGLALYILKHGEKIILESNNRP